MLEEKLNAEIEKIEKKARSRSLACERVVLPSLSSEVALIVVGQKAAIFSIVEEEDAYIIYPFKINVYKWNWARLEGFTPEQVFGEELRDEILTLCSRKEIYKHLKIS